MNFLKKLKELKKNKMFIVDGCNADILNIKGEEKFTAPLSADKIEFMCYDVTFDELFNVIHEADIAVGHGERNRMTKVLNHKFKNVTVDRVYRDVNEAMRTT